MSRVNGQLATDERRHGPNCVRSAASKESFILSSILGNLRAFFAGIFHQDFRGLQATAADIAPLSEVSAFGTARGFRVGRISGSRPITGAAWTDGSSTRRRHKLGV